MAKWNYFSSSIVTAGMCPAQLFRVIWQLTTHSPESKVLADSYISRDGHELVSRDGHELTKLQNLAAYLRNLSWTMISENLQSETSLVKGSESKESMANPDLLLQGTTSKSYLDNAMEKGDVSSWRLLNKLGWQVWLRPVDNCWEVG